MSYPPTEYAEVSNDSLFSDSAEFDRAEKPLPTPDVNHDPVIERTVAEAEYSASNLGTDLRSRTGSIGTDEPIEPPPPPTAAYLKPRRLPTRKPQSWQPISLPVPAGDDADEFDIAYAQEPVYDAPATESSPAQQKRSDTTTRTMRFANGEPDMHGDVSNCFEEPGLLYRIVDKHNRVWGFYNDSLVFEIHVTCTFGKHSKIEALDNTQLSRNANGEYVAEVVVYPCETERFVKGFVNGFSSKLRALPLSDAYYAARAEAQAETIRREIAAIEAAAGGDVALLQDAESILQLCLDHHLPFVDLTFPPTQSSLDRGAAHAFKPLPWARPRMYLPAELHDQVRLFRRPIEPGAVDQGELGDCWLTCAIATVAESGAAVMNLFRHPRGPDAGRRERALGAYRVTFNRHGLWRSVLVDDYVPVLGQSPKFARGLDPCELWPAILQKAYAKVFGSYARIQAGDPVHALTDLTGCASMRFDEAWQQAAAPTATRSEAGVSARAALLRRWSHWCEAGHRVIVTTPGKAPAVVPGTHNELDFSDEPELGRTLGQAGLVPGHAYTVLAVRTFVKEGRELVCLRRAWRTTGAASWTADWSPQSVLWTTHPAIATAVHFDPRAEDVLWIAYDDLLRHGNGGGVCFTGGAAAAWDYRVPLTFARCRPSVVCALHVSAPTTLTLSLSNIDPRTLRDDDNDDDDNVHRGNGRVEMNGNAATGESGNGVEYAPVMLSLCAPSAEEKDTYAVLLNTSTDVTQPSDSKWTFLQAREIAMTCTLAPHAQPYLVIPRLMELDAAPDAATLRAKVESVYFANDHRHTMPDSALGKENMEVPVTLGIRTAEPLVKADVVAHRAASSSSTGSVAVRLCKLDAGNCVFENFPKFPSDDLGEVPMLYYQVKEPGCGYALERRGNDLV